MKDNPDLRIDIYSGRRKFARPFFGKLLCCRQGAGGLSVSFHAIRDHFQKIGGFYSIDREPWIWITTGELYKMGLQ